MTWLRSRPNRYGNSDIELAATGRIVEQLDQHLQQRTLHRAEFRIALSQQQLA